MLVAAALAELQARVVELERIVKASWFMGPLWKRSLATFVHWFLGYALIGLIVAGVMLLFSLLIAAIDR